MPARIGPTEGALVFRFGGGLRTAMPEDEIDPRELSDGFNFLLDSQTRELRLRPPFDLVGTAPNAGRINGFICRDPSSGDPDLLVQAGDTVYQIDSSYSFSSVGTVDSNARLRGRIEHNWHLTSDVVLITDIALADVVMQWDGTYLTDIAFLKSDGSTSFGTFGARYVQIANERAIFSNIDDNGMKYGHLVVSSKLDDYTIISTADRPSSSLSAADPWYLVSPDNRYINGMAQVFNQLVISSKNGSLHQLSGSDATDFNLTSLYRRSGASGDEAMVDVGNDLFYGRDGRIESLVSTNTYGDTAADDLTLPISDIVAAYSNWIFAYNQRNQRVYCYPNNKSRLLVLHKPLIGGNLSPWSLWKTQHAMGFNPTCMMNALDPSDGLEYVFLGDSSGNVYRLEGSGTSGDGGTTNINLSAVTGMGRPTFNGLPLDAEVYDIEGWIIYRRPLVAVGVALDFRFNGKSIFNKTIDLTLPAGSPTGVWGSGGGFYWGSGGGTYWGQAFSARRSRQAFNAAGKSNEFQIAVGAQTNTSIRIIEIGVRFKAAS